MGKEDSNKELNEFEKQLEEIKEWQNNAHNPGYYIGTGRVPLPLKNLSKSPKIMLIVGIILIIPTVINTIKNPTIDTIIDNFIIIAVGFLFIVGGIIRILKRE